jgi:HEPN domain-containing protein
MSAIPIDDPVAAHHSNPAVAAWLEKAVGDLLLARKLLKENNYFDASCFHSQQGAEKVIKAFLASRGSTPPKVHDLGQLGTLVAQHAPGWVFNIQELSDLSGAAVETRYPGFFATQADAAEAFRIASDLWDAVRPLI